MIAGRWVRGMARAALVAAALDVGWSAPAAQEQAYRGGTDIVAVYATVTDVTGHLVPDLQKTDFIVSDNGKKQPIVVFSNDIQPITIIVMLDRSGSMVENYGVVREATDTFITKLMPADKARIGSLSHNISILPEKFTSDQQVLHNVVRYGMEPAGPSPIWTAVDRSITALLPEGGRRVVLLFSDGHDNTERGQVHTDVKDVMWRSKVDEIMIYAIGFASEGAQLSAPYIRGWPGMPRGGQPQWTKHVEPPDPALKELASESGGGYFEMDERLNLSETFARVADELHHQYLLGFVPAKLDEREHKLEVKVTRPEMTVRARKSYVAQPPVK